MSHEPGREDEPTALRSRHSRLASEVEALRLRADLGHLYRRVAWTAAVVLPLLLAAIAALYQFRAWFSWR